MTALPAMIVTGTAAQILGNLTGGSTLTETALYKVAVTFVPNVPPDEFVLWENRLEGVPPVVAYFAPDGTLKRNGDPVKLLANDSGLNVTGLQWTCKIDGKVQFTFNAGVAGEVIDLGTVVHTPSTSVVALTTVPLTGIQGSGVAGRTLLADATMPDVWADLGTVPDANLPNLALITFKGHKADQAAMLATTGESGDWVIRDDSSTVWVVTGTPTTTLGSWTQWPYPAVTWSNLIGRPAVVAGGADQASARAAIDAQQADTDLTAIADIAPANDDVMQRKAGAWVNRMPAQLKTDLALTKADVSLGNADNVSDVDKPVSTAQATADATVLTTATGRAIAFAIALG